MFVNQSRVVGKGILPQKHPGKSTVIKNEAARLMTDSLVSEFRYNLKSALLLEYELDAAVLPVVVAVFRIHNRLSSSAAVGRKV